MDLLLDSAIWLLVSFLIFCFILVKFGKAAFTALLDSRIEEIKKDLETSENLRVEAQELLAQYQRKHRDALKEAEQVVATAESHASEIRKNAEKDLQETIERREKQLKERIASMEADAISEIKKHAANLAVHAAEQIVINNMDKKTASKLIENTISQSDKNLH